MDYSIVQPYRERLFTSWLDLGSPLDHGFKFQQPWTENHVKIVIPTLSTGFTEAHSKARLALSFQESLQKHCHLCDFRLEDQHGNMYFPIKSFDMAGFHQVMSCGILKIP